MTEVSLVIGVVALVVAVLAVVQMQAVRRKLAVVPDDGNVVELLHQQSSAAAVHAATVHELGERVSAIESRLPYAISYIGVVGYNAFGNIAGNQSRSIALLNQRGDGLVISLLVARDETVFYTKQIAGGKGIESLSPEEVAAVDRALGR